MSIFSTPSYNSGYMNKVADLLSKQSTSISDYFSTANTSLESQYKTLYGSTMQGAVGKLASAGIYNSPASQISLNRTTQSLADTYANAKSSLAGQQMSAESGLAQQQISYYETLANQQYQQQLAQSQSDSSLFGTIAGLGAALLF